MHTVSVSIIVPHPPREVWKDLTEGRRVGCWFADSDDLRPEGPFRFDFGDGDYFLGRVTGWEEARCLGLEWRFMGLGPTFQIRLELTPAGVGTEVRVHDCGARTAAEAESLREGWIDFLSRLERFARTGQPARYEWSQTLGTAAFAPGTREQVLGMLQDPQWWHSGFPGVGIVLHEGKEAHQMAVEFGDPAWGGARTRALAHVEDDPRGTYVGITHGGWTELPVALQVRERRRFAGLWARALARFEQAPRVLAAWLLVALTLLLPGAGLAAAPLSAPVSAGRCLAPHPAFQVAEPERRLPEIESLAKAIKKTTRKGICAALQSFDFEGIRPWLTPGARVQRLYPQTETPVVEGPRTRGTLVRPAQPACFGNGADFVADLQRLTSGWMRVDRCAFDPFIIYATQGTERRAVVNLHLWLGGAEPSGARVSDKGDVVAEWVEDASGTWRLDRLEYGEREHFRASGLAFSDWTERAGLPTAWPDVGYRHELSYGQILYGGIAVGDYDGDGWPDLYISRTGANVLLRNDGHGGFEDVTSKAGVGDPGNSQSALFVDLDNDGKLDLVVVNAWYSIVEGEHSKRGHAIYRNNGDGTFKLVRMLGPVGPASGLSAADFDNDGKLDLYITYYQDEALNPYHHRIEASDGFGNRLYRNRGNFEFEDVTAKAGVAGHGWSYSSAWADFDEDGRIDLVVANDFGDNALYRNKGDGTFEEVAARAHALDPANGMSVDWGDYDNDGHLDLYFSNMYSKTGNQYLALYRDIDETLRRKLAFSVTGNTLYRNQGHGTFEEVARPLGTNVAGWAWGANYLDYDNDGWSDLHVANGFWEGDSPEDA